MFRDDFQAYSDRDRRYLPGSSVAIVLAVRMQHAFALQNVAHLGGEIIPYTYGTSFTRRDRDRARYEFPYVLRRAQKYRAQNPSPRVQ